MKKDTEKIFLSTIILVLFVFLSSAGFSAEAEQPALEDSPGMVMAQQAEKGKTTWSTTDHSKHKILNQDFTSGSDITKACLSCHSEADDQIHKTVHWTWLAGEPVNGKQYGKGADSVNNFCISANNMNDKGCVSCHIGWSGKDDQINCLVCHGQNNVKWKETFDDLTYFHKEGDPESLEMAQELQGELRKAVVSIARPTRQNCGSCHFYGGGGDGVKHGDLDSSLTKPSKNLDVHMGIDGKDFACTRCHTTELHNISGRIYTAPAYTDRKSLLENDQASRITCESCHGSRPHKSGLKENDHTDRVACQSCHIPEFARVNPTKMKWDWSKAGKTKDGKPYTTEDQYGQHNYMSIKGEMKWEKNVKPQYYWYNGSLRSLTTKDIIDPTKTVYVSKPTGKREEPNARIYPFKVHEGVQPYDKIHKTLLAPLLSGDDGFFTKMDFQLAFNKGMAFSGVPYSGQFDFVNTKYFFPTTHMVAPKSDVVSCNECHTRNNSRLANLTGFYMPGRDRFTLLCQVGWLIIALSAVGVLLHGAGRIFFSGKRKE
ncbi:MAG: tetrathionate reductase family octaheme c-type cytochrome [Desulfobacteraceae bacterium]|nr:MAG: tetrathionate reductase family octaheme c-type cytochrome [Desulfobacteraceae bacterium]